ncbi:bifunctional serine/threonine-protein kinase/formylglycine-generating enzyme family protein [Chiayiivirga flava]|uniref:Protein kinase domain-containing protein n=1 Tax=Chiayiivirga flava TaxID=659595 RepID=A0A7W8DB74_9GAMM|nr:bifunctional serine/threonine-protein kinase/formylglycine-generating enzyme family protein [Chiayiivirga flava]MBB5209508.1 hypothetical protein [Chiayiivirga flava]
MHDTPETPASDAIAPAVPGGLPRVAGYRIERVLGRGGMAVVYLAVQESLDRQVAIKVMMPAGGLDEAQSQRFELEARTIAKLEHPGIVGIHEVGRTADGQLYYVMPYLSHGDLSERDYRDDEDGLIALLRTLLDALGYAHARGIVHRDVKAENVLFNNADQPQLADFGIALSRKGATPRVTTDGLALGSGGHMPPEQARGAVVDGRADLYSLGVLTYELLTGDLPYYADDALALAVMHAHDPIPRLPGEKAHWQDFIDQAMAKSPERRFRNAQAMARALERVNDRLHPRGGIVGWLTHPAWRRPGVLVALGALAAVCIAVAVWPRGEMAPAGAVDAAPAAPAPAARLDPQARAAIETRLGEAAQQLAAGALLVPAGANAAESYLDVLKADPGNAAARAGLDAVLAALSASLVDAAQAEGAEASRERYRQAVLFADVAQLRDGPGFAALREDATRVVLAAIDARIAAWDAPAAAAWLPLAEEVQLDATALAALRERIDALPAPGETVRDGDGPELAFIPAADGAPPFALMLDEVSRGDYARFADATGREAGRCRSRLSPLQLFDKRDWRDPGFAQGPTEPVVCVSLDDAQAYAAWLSRRSGQRYRIPTAGEWRRAARLGSAATGCAAGNVFDRSADGRGTRHACTDGSAHTAPAGRYPASALGLHHLLGNVSEWTLNCGSADNALARTLESDACPRRAAIGPSWRDGPMAANAALQMLPPERGYDDVGFRLLREF